MYLLSRVADLVEGEADRNPPLASFNIAVVPSVGAAPPLVLQFGGQASPNDWTYAWSALRPKTSAELSWLPGTLNPVQIPVAIGTRQISIFVRALDDALLEGDESLELSLAPGTANTAPQSASLNIKDKQSPLPPGASIVLQADADAIGEGQTASFTIYAQGLASGAVIPYTVGGVSASDLDGVPLVGSATVDSRGTARVLLPVSNDNLTEGSETLMLRLCGSVDQSASQLVLDTSRPLIDYSNNPLVPTPVWFAPSSSSTLPSPATGSSATLILSNTVQGGSDPADYVRFSVPPSQSLSRIVLENYSSVDGVAFIAIERGAQITATESNPGTLSGYTHFGTGVPGLGEGANLIASLGGPLAPGDYSLWIQQVGATTSYRLRLQTESMHGPGSRVVAKVDAEVLLGSASADTISGEAGDDLILGGEAEDSLEGGAGGDTLVGGSGNDFLDGGDGTDIAVFQYARADYLISVLSSGTKTVRHQGRALGDGMSDGSLALGPTRNEGTDNLRGVERVQFADRSLAYDLNGNAGKTAKIIGAVFGKAAVANAEYVGIGLHYLEKLGSSDEDLVNLAIAVALGGAPTEARFKDLVELLYNNVVGTKPSVSEASVFVQLLSSQIYTPAGLALFAAETTLNAANIDLLGLATTGLEYLPFAA